MKAEKELQKAHDELEQRVRERTAELARTNERLYTEIDEREKKFYSNIYGKKGC